MSNAGEVNAWKWWQDALAGKFGDIHDGCPEQGFYRVRDGKHGPFLPVAIWNADGRWIAQRNGKDTSAEDIWTWCCRNPISEEAYYAALDGKGWPDEPTAPTMGHNLPDDPHEALALEYAAEKETAIDLLKTKVVSQEQANRIAILSKRITTIAKKASDLHKVEKQPHLDGGRAVDEKWRELKEDPAELSKRLKRHMDDYLLEQQRLERERQRKAQEEADRKRREAEDAARAAKSSENEYEAAKAERLAREAAEAEKEAEARNSSAGRTGARVALRTFPEPRITDYDALLLALKDRAEVREVVESLAKRAARSRVSLPGMEIIEVQRAA